MGIGIKKGKVKPKDILQIHTNESQTKTEKSFWIINSSDEN